MIRPRLAVMGALASLILSVPASAIAAPTEQLACGAVVTHDVKLGADVSCPDFQSPGLTVGADNITIDLNGHQVMGGVGEEGTVGVLNQGNSSVTIRNGTVTQFGTLIQATGASRDRFTKLTGNAGFTQGIAISGGTDNSVTNSNVLGRAVAIAVSGSDHARIIGNTVSSPIGTAIDVASNNVVVTGNTSTIGGPVGIHVAGSSNRIGDGNAVGNSLFAGIEVASGSGNVLRGNWVFNGYGDGLLIDQPATNTAIRVNAATGNHGDGIHVQSVSTRIVDNTADNNGNYGIEAVPGVFSVGNHADGNGNLCSASTSPAGSSALKRRRRPAWALACA